MYNVSKHERMRPLFRRGGRQGRRSRARQDRGSQGSTRSHAVDRWRKWVAGWIWTGEDEAGDWLAGDPEGKTKWRQGGGFSAAGRK